MQAVVEYLQSLEHSQRRPEATARLLVLVVKLYLARIPWPSRPVVAGHLGVSLPLVDVAISQRRAQKLIKVVIETVRGRVKRRDSVITHRYIEPCPELLRVVEGVEGATTGLVEGQRRVEAGRSTKRGGGGGTSGDDDLKAHAG